MLKPTLGTQYTMCILLRKLATMYNNQLEDKSKSNYLHLEVCSHLDENFLRSLKLGFILLSSH